MPKTYPRVSFGLYGLEIKQDSNPTTSTPLQPFSKVQDLRTDAASIMPLATFEPDFWLLDGNFSLLPANIENVHVGLMSLAMSDANGDFPVAPVVTVTFSKPQSSDGLVIRFQQHSGDWAKSVTVAYYNAADSLIQSTIYAPTSPELSTGAAVSDFQKIVITFTGTNKPYRYLRVTGIDYGELLYFERDDILEARVVEEVNPLSLELPASELGLTVHSADAQFSILNPAGKYMALYQRQPITMYEVVNNRQITIGQYYLNIWRNTSETEVEFEAVDLLGVLDSVPYRGGLWLGGGVSVGDLLEEIFTAAGVAYELDSSLSATVVRGWIPYSSARSALQQIGFAVGAMIFCTRSGAVRILPARIAGQAETFDGTITRAEKGESQSLELKTLVTGVDVTAHNYITKDETIELFNGSLEAGEHEIAFQQPMRSLSITGATITASGANFAIINVASAGTVILSGLTYADATRVYSTRNTTLPASIKPNIVSIEDATLVNNANVGEVAARVFAYYGQRYLQNLRLYAPGVEVGDVVLVETLYNRRIQAMVERMEIDLARGMTANVKLTGAEYALD